MVVAVMVGPTATLAISVSCHDCKLIVPPTELLDFFEYRAKRYC